MPTDIDGLEKRQEQIDKEAEEAIRIAEQSHLFLKPKGIFFKRCPEDSRRLKKRHWILTFSVGGDLRSALITLYSCDCGYRYAKIGYVS
jgi:hypothetical protein